MDVEDLLARMVRLVKVLLPYKRAVIVDMKLAMNVLVRVFVFRISPDNGTYADNRPGSIIITSVSTVQMMMMIMMMIIRVQLQHNCWIS